MRAVALVRLVALALATWLASPTAQESVVEEQPTAAVCFAGHVRGLLETYPSLRENLLDAFPNFQSFFFLNLKSMAGVRRASVP